MDRSREIQEGRSALLYLSGLWFVGTVRRILGWVAGKVLPKQPKMQNSGPGTWRPVTGFNPDRLPVGPLSRSFPGIQWGKLGPRPA